VGVAKADELQEVKIEKHITHILNSLFNALSTGDTETLRSLFAGEMYDKNKILLEENEEYPDFLRSYYQGAIFTITEIKPQGENITAGFTVILPSGKKKNIHVQLAKRAVDFRRKTGTLHSVHANPRQWFIVKQVEADN
jgi:hypothetical protein